MLLLSQSPISATSTTGGASTTTSATSRWNTVTLNKRFFSKTKSNSCSSTFPSKNFRSPSRFTLAKASADGESRPVSTSSSSPSSTSQFDDHEDETVFVGEEDVPLEGVIQLEKSSSSSKTSQVKKWGKVALLATGDALFLLAFSAIGRFSHGLPVLDFDTVRTADPFLAGWFLSAYFLGGYSEDGRGENGRTNAIIAAARSWALGIPLGVAIRTFKVGHIPPSSFILITMGSTAVLLIGWRTLLYSILPSGQTKGNDDYRRGNPFELFELLTSLVRRW